MLVICRPLKAINHKKKNSIFNNESFSIYHKDAVIAHPQLLVKSSVMRKDLNCSSLNVSPNIWTPSPPPNNYKMHPPNILNLPNLLNGDHLVLRT